MQHKKHKKKVQIDAVGTYRPEGFDFVQDTLELHAVLVLFLQLIKLFKFSNTIKLCLQLNTLSLCVTFSFKFV